MIEWTPLSFICVCLLFLVLIHYQEIFSISTGWKRINLKDCWRIVSGEDPCFTRNILKKGKTPIVKWIQMSFENILEGNLSSKLLTLCLFWYLKRFILILKDICGKNMLVSEDWGLVWGSPNTEERERGT